MHWLDLAVIALYLAAITWFGARFGKSQRNLKDYFLGGKTAPWWAIALSIVSAETSTLTVIGTPVLSFQGNFGFLQVVLGYLLARVVIAAVFLPAYFRGEMFTAYELMRRRFGERIRKLTAGTFLILRALAEGVRVVAISLVIAIIFGAGEKTSIVAILCLTLFYTYEGGMTAVIWTDVVQMFLYVAGAALSLAIILREIPGGWPRVAAVAAETHKFHVFDFGFSLTQTYTFWAGVIGGCFLTTASHGTEQLMVQRLLAAPDERQSRAALLASWVVIAIQFTLFLVIGVCLYTFYSDRHEQPPAVLDKIYPQFIWDHLPAGIAGLVIAAILAAAMSNLSAALNALASTTVIDFLKPADAARGLRLARLATIFWAAVLFGVGLLARQWGSVLEAGLSIASIIYGSLLGVFLLGLLTRRVGETAAMWAMSAGLALMLYIRFATPIAWTWYVVIGASATFLTGLAVSLIVAPRSR
ncbi:MAG TPA: sodium:solute symporter [Bryobacteraceae bacterium]|jgi:SSS family solute:Na+ symporter|nr:sodium:solute symporter [Bryobacteraceae bacterium]